MTQTVKAQYDIVRESPDTIFIEDTGHGHTRSVTNDAEAVVYELFNRHKIGDKRIVYKDSDGRWDELLHDGDQFTDFAPYRFPVPDQS